MSSSASLREHIPLLAINLFKRILSDSDAASFSTFLLFPSPLLSFLRNPRFSPVLLEVGRLDSPSRLSKGLDDDVFLGRLSVEASSFLSDDLSDRDESPLRLNGLSNPPVDFDDPESLFAKGLDELFDLRGDSSELFLSNGLDEPDLLRGDSSEFLRSKGLDVLVPLDDSFESPLSDDLVGLGLLSESSELYLGFLLKNPRDVPDESSLLLLNGLAPPRLSEDSLLLPRGRDEVESFSFLV
jgi:hypothetical protein